MEHQRADRVVDVASVVLISIAAVLTAICSYQSGRWDGRQAQLYNRADAEHTYAAEASDRSNVLTAIDVGVFLNYLDAVDRRDQRMADFLAARMRPEMRPAMRAWLATRPLQNPRAPSSPFVMPQYTLRTRTQGSKWEADAHANFEAAIVANRHADDFLLLTVIFAGVSFLAGISTKLVFPRHLALIVIGGIATAYGLVRLVELPFLF
ncbi:MAG: hypothetical protein JO113_03395 [Candidatus Eremiobacteraeota bacterium]|nr:hypothetical protein [Candidatus Eremiobacteraeota bacterium]